MGGTYTTSASISFSRIGHMTHRDAMELQSLCRFIND